MSHPSTVNWLESAKEGMEQCIATGNYPMCLEVIRELASNDFISEARDLEQQLLEVPISNFKQIVWQKA